MTSSSLTIFLSDAWVINVSFLAKPALNRIFRVRNRLSVGGGGGGGGTPLHKLYWYVPPQRIGFLRCFGLKTGIDFAHFGLASGMVF